MSHALMSSVPYLHLSLYFDFTIKISKFFQFQLDEL